MKKNVIIIGAGHAGIQAAASLREEGFEGSICIFSEDADFPYQKPPLSKGYLDGSQQKNSIMFRSEAWYENNQVELKLGEIVEKVDIPQKAIQATSGVYVFDFLVFATGAYNRELAIPIQGKDQPLYLRTMKDADYLKQALDKASVQDVLVIGGGFIGLEIAAYAAKSGKKVTVVEYQPRLMQRVLPPMLSEHFAAKHQEYGVKLLMGMGVQSLHQEGRWTATLSNGEAVSADKIIVGIGVLPAQALAEEAGIRCSNGIEVNEFCETSVAGIYAIGDCALHPNPFAKGQLVRLESVQNAVDQAKVIAASICGKPTTYHQVPWFWTHQYNLKLQMAGLSEGYDQLLVRGNVAGDKFSVFYFKAHQLIAVDSINKPADHLQARKWIQAGYTPDLEKLADDSIKLNEC
ncbi:MAG: NAD(P)/FAD-dependent oxidoreductase [Mongoliitalea sp.]